MKVSSLVKEIIEENTITRQTDITDILFRKYNISVTQSNISRILKQIKAVKVVNSDKDVVYEIQEKLGASSVWAKRLIKKIDDNGYNIVVTSYPASGQIIAQAIDERNFRNVLGTIAGDNNLLVVPRDVSKIKELRVELEKFLLH